MPNQSFGRFEKVLRVGEGRRIKRLQQQAAHIATLEPDVEALSDAELLAASKALSERVANGEPLDDAALRGVRAGARGAQA